MTLSPEPTVYALIFLGGLFLVEGIYLAVFGPSTRLGRVGQPTARDAGHDAGREAVLVRQAERASIAFAPDQPEALMAVLGAVAFAGLTFATQAAFPVRVATALAMAVSGIVVRVQRRAKKRMELTDEQLPDGIDLMVRSLRVGHPFFPALMALAIEIPDSRYGDGSDR